MDETGWGRLDRLETDFRQEIRDVLSKLSDQAVAIESLKSIGKFDKWLVGILMGLVGGMATFIVDHMGALLHVIG